MQKERPDPAEEKPLIRGDSSRWFIAIAIWALGAWVFYWVFEAVPSWLRDFLYIPAFFYVALLPKIHHWVRKFLGDC